MSDINEVVKRGQQRYGEAQFDLASKIVSDSFQDPGTRDQFIAAVARNTDGDGIIMRRASELMAKSTGREGPKNDEREARISRINVKSAMYDTVSDADWHAAFSKTYGEKSKKRR